MSGRVLLNVIIIFLIINLITVLKINHRMNEINNSLTAKEAVTLFVKTGTEIEQDRDPNKRQNDIFSRKYYIAALTDESKAVKVTVTEA